MSEAFFLAPRLYEANRGRRRCLDRCRIDDRRAAHAAGSDILKVGLIGCGGRGTGAAVNALSADKGARLTAMADVFAEKMPPAVSRSRPRGPIKWK